MSKARDLADSYTDSEIDSLDDLLAPKADPSFTGTPTINGSNAVSNTTLRTELNATGSAPIYACRAWVNFNGTGTVAIRASGNVSSITDNGTGIYRVNFVTAMPDANYSLSTIPLWTAGAVKLREIHIRQTSDLSTSSCSIYSAYEGSSDLRTPGDIELISCMFIR